MDTTTRRPVIVDTALAAQHTVIREARAKIAAAMDTIHRAADSEFRYISRRKTFTTPADVAEQVARDRIADGTIRSYNAGGVTRALDTLTHERAVVAAAQAAMVPLDAEFRAAPWSRFFLTQTSSGGHLHASMSCGSLHPTTQIGWCPQESGQTEADAVAAHGPLLCTRCFPSAPLEWTVGNKPTVTYCEGSNTFPTEVNRRGRTSYATCPTCQTTQTYTMSGIRKHKPATA